MTKKIKIGCIICIVCSLFMMVGCNKESAPGNDKIKKDLQETIVEYKDFLQLKNYTINKSLTNENTYSAEISVIAESKYAALQITAEVYYTKYDQGWELDTCEWVENKSEVIKWPDEKEMEKIVNNYYEEEHEYNLKFNSMKCDEDTIVYVGEKGEKLNSYIALKEKITSYWKYDGEEDTWIYEKDECSRYCEFNEIEGTWEASQGEKTGNVIISNVTNTGFDIRSELLDSSTVCVTLAENMVSYYEGKLAVLTFNGNGAKCSLGSDFNVVVTFIGDSILITFAKPNYVNEPYNGGKVKLK